MASDDLAIELAKLKAEVAALSEARNSRIEETDPTPEATPEASAPGVDADPSAMAELEDRLKGQLEELGSLLQQEIRDLPTITCLSIFSLGILMGRLLR